MIVDMMKKDLYVSIMELDKLRAAYFHRRELERMRAECEKTGTMEAFVDAAWDAYEARIPLRGTGKI